MAMTLTDQDFDFSGINFCKNEQKKS
jgi:hypothetical protein